MCASLVFWVTGLHPRVCTFGFPLRVSSLYQVFLFSFLFFLPLTLSIPLLLPFAMILLRDPSSRSFFEMEVNGGGKRMFFSEKVSMKSSSKTNQRDCNEVDSWSR